MEYLIKRAVRRPLRLEICAWQRAAAGLLAVSVAANTALYGLLGRSEALRREETDKLRSEVRSAEQVRDHALRELGALALDTAQERQARAEQAAAYEAMGAYRYIGECTITAYCPCEMCCGVWADGLTATGIPAGPGIVAVDPQVVPLGSTVIINGQRYLAADTGGLIRGLRVDVCVPDHETALAFGVQEAAVWVEQEAEP